MSNPDNNSVPQMTGIPETVDAMPLPSLPSNGQLSTNATALFNELGTLAGQERRGWILRGAGYAAIGLGTTAAIAFGSHSHGKISYPVPFERQLQHGVEAIDGVMVGAGEIGLPAGILALGGLSLAARRKPAAAAIENGSETPLSDEAGKFGKVLSRATTVGSFGVFGVALASGIGYNITEGPGDAVQHVFDQIPGQSMVVQYAEALPMTESKLPKPLIAAAETEAKARHITATSINFNLGSVTVSRGNSFTTLVAGIEKPGETAAQVDQETNNCQLLPLKVDASLMKKVGDTFTINGMKAVATGISHNTSAINRVGFETTEGILDDCLNNDASGPDHALMLDTDPATAREIMDEAQKTVTSPRNFDVITKKHYLQNSAEFWKANVKPVTNVQALTFTLLSIVSMGAVVGSGLFSNRREWATKLGQGVSENALRLTEMARSLKSSLVNVVIGGTLAAPLLPLVNALEPGMSVGLEARSFLAAAGVGIFGGPIGAFLKLLRPRKVANPAEQTGI